MELKRVAAIHDISGFGKCSLTVALPIISAAGIETSVIPTAVLSTHTGGFTGFTYRDLTEDIMPIVYHWKTLDITFDGIYTGFLGSFEQVHLIEQTIDKLKTEKTVVVIDPVMADNGELYAIFSKEFPKEMAKLCKKADLLIPNLTEASLLLEEPYMADGTYTQADIEGLLKRLSDLCQGDVVLTGISFEPEKLGAAVYERKTDKIAYAFTQRIEGYYHGTGDVFASAVTSGVLNGFTLAQSAQIAVDFTAAAILRTKNAGTDIRFGVNFEQESPSFLKALKLV